MNQFRNSFNYPPHPRQLPYSANKQQSITTNLPSTTFVNQLGLIHSPNIISSRSSQRKIRQIVSPNSYREHYNTQDLANHIKSIAGMNQQPNSLGASKLCKAHNVFSPTSRLNTKPKISFSYSRQSANESKSKQFIGSCRQVSKESQPDRIKIKQFQLVNKKQSIILKQLKIRLCSNVFNQLFNPKAANDGDKDGKDGRYMKSIVNTKCSDTSVETRTGVCSVKGSSKKQRQFNFVSTQMTQSYYFDTKESDLQRKVLTRRQHKQNSQQFYSNHSHNNQKSIVKHGLLEKLQPSKQLKNTIMVNNYDFGGIYCEPNYSKDTFATCEKVVSKDNDKQIEDRRWKSYVKCLFISDDDEDMKQSIHCGPQIRHERIRYDILNGFGRQIQESVIPNFD